MHIEVYRRLADDKGNAICPSIRTKIDAGPITHYIGEDTMRCESHLDAAQWYTLAPELDKTTCFEQVISAETGLRIWPTGPGKGYARMVRLNEDHQMVGVHGGISPDARKIWHTIPEHLVRGMKIVRPPPEITTYTTTASTWGNSTGSTQTFPFPTRFTY